MRVETTKPIHSPDHRLPVDRLLRGAKARRANLVAVGAHHFEVQPVARALELQLGEGTAGGALHLQFLAGGRFHRDGYCLLAVLHVFDPLVALPWQSGANSETGVVQAVDPEAPVGLGENGSALASVIVKCRDHHASHRLPR